MKLTHSDRQAVIVIRIPGRPVPLARHRAFLSKKKIMMYDSQRIKKHATQVLMTREAVEWNGPPLMSFDAFHVDITFCFYKPGARILDKSWNLDEIHCEKPDIDNLIKYVLDCGNSILWKDDSKIKSIYAKKVYGKSNYTEIRVTPMKKLELVPSNQKILKEFSTENIRQLAMISKELVDFCENSRQCTTPDQVAIIASTLQTMADNFAESLMRIKNRGEKYGAKCS